jgi:simple sugar transport system permease protein
MNELALQAARLALPLVLATLSEVVAERGGVVNLALEGTMLVGALAAWLVGAGGGGGALAPALLAAVLVGLLVARVQALFVVRLRADAIVSGTALHFACLGASGLVFERCKRSAGVTTFADLGGAWPRVPWIGTLLVVAVVLGFLFCTRAGYEAVGGWDETLLVSEEITMAGALKQHGRFEIVRTPAPRSRPSSPAPSWG